MFNNFIGERNITEDLTVLKTTIGALTCFKYGEFLADVWMLPLVINYISGLYVC